MRPSLQSKLASSNVIDNHDIAAALSTRLWATDLFMPRYRAGEIGDWRINPGGQLVHDWGYYTGPCLVEMLPSLARRVKQVAAGDAWETWMSLTPHEIESQELGCRHASGHTVIMGLGMGWVAANVALNSNVTKVTVVELDPDVIDLFEHCGAIESLPQAAGRKIAIVHADALQWRPAVTDTVNFLYADIWLHLAEPSTVRQVKQMQANVQAEKVYYWGQEIAIYAAAGQDARSNLTITGAAVQHAANHVLKLPLLIPTDRDYPRMIQQVIQNRMNRRLTIDVDFS
jgi:hypothetical protein